MSNRPPTDRHSWAASVVAPEPDAQLLDVGCGHGVTLAALAAQLRSGTALGLDRSAKMIAAARSRNAAAIEAGRVALLEGRFETADLPAEGFDHVLGFHVAAFWREPGTILPLTRRILRPGGTLSLFNQMPGWRQREDPAGFARDLAGVLSEHGFGPPEPRIERIDGRAVLAVQAR
jgi:ubiquinone/menaquinone biosynthesis C-methylase UbiE